MTRGGTHLRAHARIFSPCGITTTEAPRQGTRRRREREAGGKGEGKGRDEGEKGGKGGEGGEGGEGGGEGPIGFVTRGGYSYRHGLCKGFGYCRRKDIEGLMGGRGEGKRGEGKGEGRRGEGGKGEGGAGGRRGGAECCTVLVKNANSQWYHKATLVFHW
jgi:hypothetical protein